jgi:hypothetical protein
MTTRPERQTSVLAGQSPIAKKDAPKEKRKYKRVTYYPNTEYHARAEAAWYYTHEHERDMATWTEMANRALIELVRRLEAQYNNGHPFPEVPEGTFPRGRPKE